MRAVPIDHGTQVQPALVHAHIGDVHGPNLIGVSHRFTSEQVRIDLVLRMTSTGVGLAVQGIDAHARAHACGLRSGLGAAIAPEACVSPQMGELHATHPRCGSTKLAHCLVTCGGNKWSSG